MSSSLEWGRIEACLDQLLDLPARDRRAAISDITAGDPALARALSALLDQIGAPDTRLDKPAIGLIAPAEPLPLGLSAGQTVGAYRVIALIGRGGMGEVYRAERADGQFEQQVALKVIRREAIDHVSRFQFERQILARFDHPFITHIYDGGVLADGQPYMVMELVAGQPITAWCAERSTDLKGRLSLFLNVCDAVAYAHRNVVVHRDIKPANLLVTEAGQVKLLDFGIAKLLSDPKGALTRMTPMTPDYAAPEQLTGGPISTATDVYALGALLFELLAGGRPFVLDGLPLAAAVNEVLNRPAPILSRFAQATKNPQVPPHLLAGDLDAIVAKALRKEPGQRYQTVDALMQDIARSSNHQPVLARSGTRYYVMSRFVKRHRWPIAGIAVLSLAILLGLSGISWEYLRAERQATRGSAIRAFLVSLFADTDANFPAGKPRQSVTAEELVALGVPRIDREFANDPGLRVELLGAMREIYAGLSDLSAAEQVGNKQIALARRLYGDQDPIVVREIISASWNAMSMQDWPRLAQMLVESDKLLHEDGQDRSKLRAEWWVLKANWLGVQPHSAEAQQNALLQSTKLFARYDPAASGYQEALSALGGMHFTAGDFDGAGDFFRKAIAVAHLQPNGRNVDLAADVANLGQVQENQADLNGAEASFTHAAKIALDAAGNQNGVYWYAIAQQAKLMDLRGNWKPALAMLGTLLQQRSASSPSENVQYQVRLLYASCQVREGNGATTIPSLQATLAVLTARPAQANDVSRTLLTLADAYDQAGRPDDARAALRAAGVATLTGDPADAAELSGREVWGRFLLEHGQSDQAAKVFDSIIAKQGQWGRNSSGPAQAWAGRALIDLERGDAKGAVLASNASFAALGAVRVMYDIRIRAYLLRTRSAALLASGDANGALNAAQDALQQSQRTDAPGSAATGSAQRAVDAAILAKKHSVK
jgi:eukaryotic-like serine/threonine-protein kinase